MHQSQGACEGWLAVFPCVSNWETVMDFSIDYISSYLACTCIRVKVSWVSDQNHFSSIIKHILRAQYGKRPFIIFELSSWWQWWHIEHTNNIPLLFSCVRSILTVQTFYLFCILLSRPLEDGLICSFLYSGSLCQSKDICFSVPDYLVSVGFLLIEDERKIKCLQNRILITCSVCSVITQIIGRHS